MNAPLDQRIRTHMTDEGQVLIPAEVRDLIGLVPGAAVEIGLNDRAFAEYRRRGGARQAILADFLIAEHAAAIDATLVTRNRQLGSYFPDLTLITPETDHG